MAEPKVEKVEKPEPVVTIHGDEKGGWIVEVHDGDRCEVYVPEAKNADAARATALRSFAKAVKEV